MNRHIPGVAVITVCCVDYERGSERSEYEWKGHRRTCWTRRIANPCVNCVGGRRNRVVGVERDSGNDPSNSLTSRR